MKILNFGSINVDIVFQVKHIVREGETIPTKSMAVNPGGKGVNQSVALARAGASVMHAGCVGKDTRWMIDRLEQNGIDTRFIRVLEHVNGGQAIIQVNEDGQNSIILFGGANQAIPETLADEALAAMAPGDWLVLQNEINLTALMMQKAKDAGLNICFNPAPMTPQVRDYPLKYVDLLIVNEIEAAELAALPVSAQPERIIAELNRRLPDAQICMTLGAKGACFISSKTSLIWQKPFPAKAVDTTAAGDTFTGFLLAALAADATPDEALKQAASAAAVTVSRPGAMDSIPRKEELPLPLSAF